MKTKQWDIDLKDGWWMSLMMENTPQRYTRTPSRLFVGSADFHHDHYEVTFHMELWMYEYDRHSKQYRVYIDTWGEDDKGTVLDNTFVERNFFFHAPCSDEFVEETLVRQWEAQHMDYLSRANATRLDKPWWEQEEKAG